MANGVSSEITKRCPTCGETKPAEAYAKKSSEKNRLNWQCRECSKAAAKEYRANKRLTKGIGYHRFYTDEELRWRPIEHVLEDWGGRQLGAALGIGKDKAAKVRANPHEFVDTPYEIDDAAVVKIRERLEGG